MGYLEVLKWIVMTSLAGSVIVALIMFIKFFMRRRLSLALHYYIWILLLIKLLIPSGPQSPLSIFNIVNSSYGSITAKQNIASGYQNNGLQEQQNSSSSVSVTEQQISSSNNSASALAGENTARTGILSSISDYQNIFFIIWIMGIILSAVYILSGIIRIKVIVKNSIGGKKELGRILETCKFKVGLKKKIGIAVSDKISSPSLYGCFKPTIIIPKNISETLSEEQLSYVVIHELCHVKREDILISWIAVMLKAVYWFNPVVLFGLNRMKKDCELSCDAAVLSYLDKDENRAYGNTIINILELVNKRMWLPGTTSIVMNKSEIKRRVVMIAGYKKITAKKLILGFAVILLAGVIGLTGGITKSDVSPKLTPQVKSNSQISESNANGLDLQEIAVKTDSKDLKEIAKGIADKYFIQFTRDTIDPSVSIEDFTINKISDITGDANNFTFFIEYSLKPVDLKNYVLAGNGEMKGSWVEDKAGFIQVEKKGDSYVMEGIGTSRPMQTSNLQTRELDVREAVWNQLTSEDKEQINGTWQDGKLSKIVLSENMTTMVDENRQIINAKSFLGKEVYIVDFTTKRVSRPNNMIVYASVGDKKIIGYGIME